MMVHEILKREVIIPAESVMLRGDLIIPDGATGVVFLSHGSGSSRHSPTAISLWRRSFVIQILERCFLIC